jgi:two-component system OmpR family sensor kinase
VIRLLPRIGRPRVRWTLRVRMVVAIATLAAIALIVADAAGLALLHSYLLNRVDHQLTTSAAALGRPRGTAPPLPGPRPNFPHDPDSDIRLVLYDANGRIMQTGGDNATQAPALGSFSEIRAHLGGRPYTVSVPGGSWRVIVTARPHGTLLAIAVSLGQVTGTARRLMAIDVAVTALVLLLLASAAASVVRIGLLPLTDMEASAERIAAGDLSARISTTDPHTESGRLGLALNAMLARIQAALADRTASERRLRQFLADASHELRTPLTSIQGFAELYRRGGAQPGPELDEAMSRIEAEAARMAVLVADLLLLARLDQERPLERAEVDLFAIAADTVRDARARAPHRWVRLAEFELPPAAEGAEFAPPAVCGDEARLRQVATNLVANALQHTPPGARVTLRVGRATAGALPAEPENAPPPVTVGPDLDPSTAVAILEVFDTGPGMTADQAERAFERLYRTDLSRQRGSGGAGLGLSIVAAIVGAHGGRVELRTAPGAGSAFRVVLPAVVEPDAEPPTVIDGESLDTRACLAVRPIAG